MKKQILRKTLCISLALGIAITGIPEGTVYAASDGTGVVEETEPISEENMPLTEEESTDQSKIMSDETEQQELEDAEQESETASEDDETLKNEEDDVKENIEHIESQESFGDTDESVEEADSSKTEEKLQTEEKIKTEEKKAGKDTATWESVNEERAGSAIESTIQLNSSYSGRLLSRDEVRKYKFKLTSAGRASISFSHANLNNTQRYWVLRIYNDKNEVVVELDSAGIDVNKTSADVGLPAGNYYVQINSDNYEDWCHNYSSDNYQFKVNYLAATNWETETNDSYADSDSILLNKVYNGANQFSDDLDYYKFVLGSSGKVNINFQHTNLYDQERYWVLRVRNEKMEEVLALDIKGTDTNIISADVGLPKGNYYIQINSDDDESYCYNYSSATYSFKVNFNQSSTWEAEVNDSYAAADNIDFNIAYNGANQFWDDVDYYKFTMNSAGEINVNFRHSNLQDSRRYWVIRLYNEKTEEIGEGDINGTDTNLNSGSIPLPKGTYYIRINSDDYETYCNNYSSNNYQLKISYCFTSRKPVLKAESVSCNKIKLSWNKIPGASGYVIYRSTSKNGKFKEIKRFASNKTLRYTDTKLTSGKGYYYKIKAYKVNAGKNYYSGYSTKIKAMALPAKVAGVAVKAQKGKVAITWKRPESISGYEIYMSERRSRGYKKIKNISKASAVKYTKNKLKKGKTYYFKIRAYKIVKGKKLYGSFSNIKSAKVKK